MWLRGNVTHDDGVYKSNDGGESWRHLGLAATHNIGHIRIHPSNPELVYIAALGYRFGANPERGVYRTQNGGECWELILDRGPDVGTIDLTVDPKHPRPLYVPPGRG